MPSTNLSAGLIASEELKNLSLQHRTTNLSEESNVLDSGSEPDVETSQPEHLYNALPADDSIIGLGPHLCNRVYEFSDQRCVLRSKAEDDGPFIEGSEVYDALAHRKSWICNLDQDVNLRALVQLPKGLYTINWICAYRVSDDCSLGVQTMQIHNCSFGEPINAAMFPARVNDPSQPFISTDLNAIINPRVTIPLYIPVYETKKFSESSDDFLLSYKRQGDVPVESQRPLQVDTDGPTAFLIKLVSSRVLTGRLWFLGVLLKRKSDGEAEGADPTEVR